MRDALRAQTLNLSAGDNRLFTFVDNESIYFGSGLDMSIDGSLYVGDTSNANNTLGLTINQGGADDEIISLKSSDIAHGITDFTETDTFLKFAKVSPTNGGGLIDGFSKYISGFYLRSFYTKDDTTKSTSGLASILMVSSKKSGTGANAMGANANILALRNYTTTTHIFDAEGDIWYTGALSSYKNATSYTGYIFVPLATTLTSTSFDGDSFSTTAATKIDLSAEFGAPEGIKAVSLIVTAQDSAAFGTRNLWVAFGPSTGQVVHCPVRPAGGDVWTSTSGIVPCDSSGDIYYAIGASGASTFDLIVRINGYFI